ncbi:hypothetical protein VNO77_36340 [Canavalia gladiata]|uniref:Ubiquitin recognition factor in ER associated degradation 1 n=1 Tax=Canavalia gladiata TaxID=3824 RepID=A0AAN9K924_CANGL
MQILSVDSYYRQSANCNILIVTKTTKSSHSHRFTVAFECHFAILGVPFLPIVDHPSKGTDSSNMDSQQINWDEEEGGFEHTYRCYSVSFIEKSSLENGDRIIMPPSALDKLVYLEIEYPMLFELRNPDAERVTHCGVQEFTADEGIIYVPYWMMENMCLEEGDFVILRSTNLVKGKFVKLQPHTKDFLDISNPKAILEISLRSYTCLTTGDTIMIAYNNNKYYIDIVETKPSPAVCIIETDCEVEFAQPLDHEEPEEHLSSALFDKESPEGVHEESATKIAQIISFTGSGRRLDGKPSTHSEQKQTESETKSSNSKPSDTASCRTPGKLVFGSNVNASKNQTSSKASLKSTSQESSQKAEKPKFQAFTGTKYSLKN